MTEATRVFHSEIADERSIRAKNRIGQLALALLKIGDSRLSSLWNARGHDAGGLRTAAGFSYLEASQNTGG